MNSGLKRLLKVLTSTTCLPSNRCDATNCQRGGAGLNIQIGEPR